MNQKIFWYKYDPENSGISINDETVIKFFDRMLINPGIYSWFKEKEFLNNVVFESSFWNQESDIALWYFVRYSYVKSVKKIVDSKEVYYYTPTIKGLWYYNHKKLFWPGNEVNYLYERKTNEMQNT
jgi:hypothetical protein